MELVPQIVDTLYPVPDTKTLVVELFVCPTVEYPTMVKPIETAEVQTINYEQVKKNSLTSKQIPSSQLGERPKLEDWGVSNKI